MPRPKRLRKMDRPPVFGGFRPIGIKGRPNNEIYLELDEYESVKLCDYEALNQADAAGVLGVSRPTLTRIYASARIKIATAIVEGRSILIRGGKVDFEDNWFRCIDCQTVFNDITLGESIQCPRCSSKNASEIGQSETSNSHSRNFQQQGKPGFCHCKTCGTRLSHRKGVPCVQLTCPNCNSLMVRDSGREVAQFAEVFTWAIPCLGNQNNSLYNSRFGKSPFFALWSPEGTTFIANPCAEDEKNVGAKIVEYLYERGIQGIVISYLGPKAEEVAILKNFRIEKIEKDNVTVTDIINILKSNYYAK